MKDKLIKLLMQTIIVGWIFISFVCALGELLYGTNLFVAGLLGFFTLQGIKMYVNA